MRSGAAGKDSGSLAEFATGFGADSEAAGVSAGIGRDQLRLMADASGWLAARLGGG